MSIKTGPLKLATTKQTQTPGGTCWRGCTRGRRQGRLRGQEADREAAHHRARVRRWPEVPHQADEQ
eukprot:3513371-Alexandrium_andersonii.AAC.1